MSRKSNATSTIPRGIRNNNPLNIRIGNTWLGEVANPTDSDFEQFVHVKYGLRAAFCILRRYIRRYHRCTVAQIVSAWAPSNENDTARYIAFVASRMKIAADIPLDYADKETMVSLVAAMACFECGQELPLEVIHESYNIA